MKKKLLALLLSMLFVISSLPLAVGAETVADEPCADNAAQVLADGEVTTVNDSEEIKNCDESNQDEITSEETINDETDEEIVPVNGNTTADSTEPAQNSNETQLLSNADDEESIASGTCGENLTWVLDKNGTLTISGTGEMYEYYDYIDNNKQSPWYEKKDLINVVQMSNGITTIGSGAFKDCEHLTNISMPNSITSIKDHAFWNCKNLKNIVFSNCLEEIGDYAFCYCTSLENVKFPDSLIKIGSDAFSSCSNLTSINIPKNVNYIGNLAFYDCSSLSEITIQGITPEIHGGAYGNAFLGTAYYNDTDNWSDGVLYIDNYLMGGRYSGQLRIKPGTKVIVADAFNGVYSDCDITSIIFPSEGLVAIGASAFAGNANLQEIVIPDGVTYIGGGAFFCCEQLENVTIPKSVTSIGENAFWGASNRVITCYKGSYADTYAQENGIPVKYISETTTIKTENGQCSVTAKDNFAFDEATQLVVKELDEAGFEVQFENSKITAFDITLQKDGNEIQPAGSVEVSIAVPQGYVGSKCKVYRAESDGSFTDMNAVYADGCLVFSTDHFSTYVIAQANETCQHSNTQTINVSEPDCTHDGYTGDLICSDCGEIIEHGQVIDKTGHSFNNGKCTVCGEKDPNYKPVTPDTGCILRTALHICILTTATIALIIIKCLDKNLKQL